MRSNRQIICIGAHPKTALGIIYPCFWATNMHSYLRIVILLVAVGPTVAVAQSGSVSSPLSPEEARANMGQNVVIEGTARVHDAERREGFYIDLNGKGPSAPFAGYIPEEDMAQFPGLNKIEGKTVDIMGVVQFRNGTPIIKMTDGQQLRVVR
jgi:hypothetical protein